jgi:hypothetical protein
MPCLKCNTEEPPRLPPGFTVGLEGTATWIPRGQFIGKRVGDPPIDEVQAQHGRLAPLLLMLLCVVSMGAWIAFLVWAAGHLTGAW